MKRLAVACAIAALGVSAGAQQIPQFRSSVDLVYLDISVLDRNRRPVRGLTAADFSILENNRPQQVAVFSAVDVPDPVPPSAAWMRDVAPDVGSNAEVEGRRLFLIAIDDAHFAGDQSAHQRVKVIARSVLDRLNPTDLAAVVFSQSNQFSQDFTSDRAKLLAALDGFPKNPGVGGSLAMLYSVGLLQRATEFLSDAPERRKAIVYIGTGVPFSIEQAARPVKATFLTTPTSNMLHRDLKARIQTMFDQAKLANVNVYTIDACGLRGGDGCAGNADIQDYLVNVAVQTGGRPVVNTNDFEPGLTAIFQENASYYLLAFQSTNPARDGSMRTLHVRVDRPGLTVRTRTGYVAPKDGDRQERARRASPLSAAVAGVLPKSDLPMVVTAAPFAVPGQRNAAVAIVVGVKQPVRQTGVRLVEQVDVQVGAFNSDGKSFGTAKMTGSVGLRAGAFDSAEYEMTARLDLKPGRYQLRVGAEIANLATAGSLYYDIVVPDFATAPVSLSGLLLSAPPSATAAQSRELNSVLPVVPTSRRVFAPGDRITAFVRAYQGGKLPAVGAAVRWRIRNADDATVTDRRQELASDAFGAARSADVRLDLPLATLPAGAYVLTIDVQAGAATARRDSRFQVIR